MRAQRLEAPYFSVVIPTFNRLPILRKCLLAMEAQSYPGAAAERGFEILVVDDASTDGSADWIAAHASDLPRVRVLRQDKAGPAAARNLGIAAAKGRIIVFIDSDLVVAPGFLAAHAAALHDGEAKRGGDAFFTYGRVVKTRHFDDPAATTYKLKDYSRAWFATGNIAIPRHWLVRAGGFDTRFDRYGFEDFELGVRLKRLGLRLVKCSGAVGFHYQLPFRPDRLPALLRRERQRARMGALFYSLHPCFDVRLMIQMTWMHRALWWLLSLGGLVDHSRLPTVLRWLTRHGYAGFAELLASVALNRFAVRRIYAEVKRITRPSERTPQALSVQNDPSAD